MSIYNGMFIDYYASGGMKTYAGDIGIVADFRNNCAAIGGTGDVPMSLTYTFDVARITIAALELPQWSQEAFIIGDTVTWNEFVSIAEEAKGVKFKVFRDSLEACKKAQCTMLPNQKILEETCPDGLARHLYSWFAVISEEGLLNHSGRTTLNARFPQLEVHTVKSFLTEAYAEK
jgi:nucleoside-diphosphate-sugar epimerase